MAYHAALLRILDSILYLLTAASLGLPSNFVKPYYSPHMPETVSLGLAYCCRRCATVNTPTIPASRSYTRMRPTSSTKSLHQTRPAGAPAKREVAPCLADAQYLRGEHRRPVRGVDKRTVAIDGLPSDEAPDRIGRLIVAAPVNIVLLRSMKWHPYRGDVDVCRGGSTAKVCAVRVRYHLLGKSWVSNA